MENILETIEHLVPGAWYSISGDDFETIVWNDKRSMPTIEEIVEVQDNISKSKELAKIQASIAAIEKQMHDYLESRYNTHLKLFFICAYIAPGCSKERKAALEELWKWIEGVVGYYFQLKAKLQKKQEVTERERDFAGIFNVSDPCLSLESLSASLVGREGNLSD